MRKGTWEKEKNNISTKFITNSISIAYIYIYTRKDFLKNIFVPIFIRVQVRKIKKLLAISRFSVSKVETCQLLLSTRHV